MTDIELASDDPSHNRRRRYRLRITSDLFGALVLEIHWGRAGHRLRTKVERYEDARALRARFWELVELRRRHGYELLVTRAPTGAPG